MTYRQDISGKERQKNDFFAENEFFEENGLHGCGGFALYCEPARLRRQ